MFISKNSIMLNCALTSGNPKQLGLYIKSNGSFILTNDTTFQSGTTYYISMGKYIVSAKFGFYKIWGKDSGRNLAGSQTGTLLGIFPKITFHFRSLSRSEVELLSPTLDSAYQSTTYYDPKKKQSITMDTYSGDWVLENKDIITENEKAEGFDWSVISVKKRS